MNIHNRYHISHLFPLLYGRSTLSMVLKAILKNKVNPRGTSARIMGFRTPMYTIMAIKKIQVATSNVENVKKKAKIPTVT